MFPASSVTVHVPASTSNCGSGFDSLGLALQLYNRVTVTRLERGQTRGARAQDERAAEMVADAARAFAAATQRADEPFVYQIDGDVPPARGLGSSVTVLAGVLAGLNALAGDPLGRPDLVSLVHDLEGHPDNASAGILGGFCAARCDSASGRYLDAVRVPVPESLVFVVVSPDLEVTTKASRGALPSQLAYFDAVKSVNSAVYLTAAFATGDYSKLRGAVGDYFHEPYRLPKIPGGRAAIDAGVAAGALTGWLSGSGSSVLCVAERGAAAATATAMQAAFAVHGLDSAVRQLVADNAGLRVERASA